MNECLTVQKKNKLLYYSIVLFILWFLGSDTAGSVRVPAAYCGILGFRPSHGAIPVVGVIPMAQSFDTVGKQSLFDSLTSLLLMICNYMQH